MSQTVTQPLAMWLDFMYIIVLFIFVSSIVWISIAIPPKELLSNSRHWWLRGQPVDWAQVQVVWEAFWLWGNWSLQSLFAQIQSSSPLCCWKSHHMSPYSILHHGPVLDGTFFFIFLPFNPTPKHQDGVETRVCWDAISWTNMWYWCYTNYIHSVYI